MNPNPCVCTSASFYTRPVSALVAENTSRVLAPGRDPDATNPAPFPEGSVRRVLSLPLRTLHPRTPAGLGRRRSPSRRAVEQSRAARPASAGPWGSPQPAAPRAPGAPEAPAGGCCWGAAGRSPGRQVGRPPVLTDGLVKELRSPQATSPAASAGRTGQTAGCANLWNRSGGSC